MLAENPQEKQFSRVFATDPSETHPAKATRTEQRSSTRALIFAPPIFSVRLNTSAYFSSIIHVVMNVI